MSSSSLKPSLSGDGYIASKGELCSPVTSVFDLAASSPQPGDAATAIVIAPALSDHASELESTCASACVSVKGDSVRLLPISPFRVFAALIAPGSLQKIVRGVRRRHRAHLQQKQRQLERNRRHSELLEFESALAEHLDQMSQDIQLTEELGEGLPCTQCNFPIQGVLCRSLAGGASHWGCAMSTSTCFARAQAKRKVRAERATALEKRSCASPSLQSSGFTSTKPVSSLELCPNPCQSNVDEGSQLTSIPSTCECSSAARLPAPAKWLMWEKTREEVFGMGEHTWFDGWAIDLIFGDDACHRQHYVFNVLARGKHLHYGMGVMSIPGEWKKRLRAKRRNRSALASSSYQTQRLVDVKRLEDARATPEPSCTFQLASDGKSSSPARKPESLQTPRQNLKKRCSKKRKDTGQNHKEFVLRGEAPVTQKRSHTMGSVLLRFLFALGLFEICVFCSFSGLYELLSNEYKLIPCRSQQVEAEPITLIPCRSQQDSRNLSRAQLSSLKAAPCAAANFLLYELLSNEYKLIPCRSQPVEAEPITLIPCRSQQDFRNLSRAQLSSLKAAPCAAANFLSTCMYELIPPRIRPYHIRTNSTANQYIYIYLYIYNYIHSIECCFECCG